MFRFGWGAQFVLTFHLTSSLPISVFTRRALQVRIIGCLTFGCSSAFIIGSCSLVLVANVQCSVDQNTGAIGTEHRLAHYLVLLELLEQLAYYQLLTTGADLLWSRWEADGTLWSGVHWYSAFSRVPQHQLIVVFNIGRCALCVLRVWSCGPWAFVLFCSCTAPILWTIQSIAQQEKPKESVDCKPALVAGIERWAFATAAAL